MNWRLLTGDVRDSLRTLPTGTARTCVTSPPYWGLRDYGVEGQLGLEPTPDAYVAAMVEVFREVRRVLAEDGTLWLNFGDSYAPNWSSVRPAGGGGFKDDETRQRWTRIDLPPKNLVGIPWRVAFALQADGWYLRSDIIWSKPNPMPESVTDRPTKAHEYLFLLSKAQKYYYDAAAIREPHAAESIERASHGFRTDATKYDKVKPLTSVGNMRNGSNPLHEDGRNKRSVWSVATQPYPEAHFATFPEALIEPCILAGSQGEGKRCDCDEVIATPTGSGEIADPSLVVGRAGFDRPRRSDEGTRPITRREQRSHAEQMRVSLFRDQMQDAAGPAFAHYIRTDASGARPLPPELLREWLAVGWLQQAEPCRCPIMPADIVLDPFTGSGTTGAVAIRHQRSFVGCELNPAYVELARQRIGKESPLFAMEGSS